MVEMAKIRLFVDVPLGEGQSVSLSRDQANYLFNVMRKGVGRGILTCREQARPQMDPPDLWLLFAPIKKARTDFIVEKATEMGAARILPVQTEFTNSERIRQDRLQAHAVEAAEQCGGTHVPPVEELQKLSSVLADWPEGRRLLFCDETTAGQAHGLAGAKPGKWAILIGPEGGFSPAELARLRGMDCVTPLTLGPRILRADTAAVAALTLWQAELGDWR
jgi:16S rRNA (uracil1498-N3)-methyltransferase